MSQFRSLNDAQVSGKIVLVRGDLNVPVKDGVVTDTTRIDRLLPTLKELAAAGAKVVLLSHFGRPKGKVNPDYTLKQVLPALEAALGQSVTFATDCVGDAAQQAITAADTFVLLENLRFHAGEEANDQAFAKQLAELGDLYVNDAFSSAHRAHASTEGLAHLLPAYAGRLMEQELQALQTALENPTRPVMAIVGGAKISTKLELLNNLVTRVDKLILGGGMANTFLLARGVDVGASLCEKDMLDSARQIEVTAKQHGCDILLPTDAVIAATLQDRIETQVVTADAVPANQMILDLGPQSVAALKEQIKACKTVVWNGPVGAFEFKPFDAATNALAQYVADLTQAGAVLSVAGGGDTVAALVKAGVDTKFSYVSTAGGAFLEWLEGKVLPGVAALMAA